MLLESKYDGACSTCGKPFYGPRKDKSGTIVRRGDRIEWSREGGSHHEKCYMQPADLHDYFDAHKLADDLGFSKPGETI